jgi:hypothetical protein
MLTAATADAFVNGLALPEPREYASLTETVSKAASAFPGAMAALQPTSGKSAAVNAGSLVSFVEGLDGQDKMDIMNSTLLAQLAANRAYDRYKHPLDWFKFYSNVLQNVWNRQHNMGTLPAFVRYTSGGATANIDQAVLKILGEVCTGNEIAVVKATLNALKSQAAGSSQITIWDANASSGTAGNFQIVRCRKVDENALIMLMGAMQFTARTSRGGFLWWTWSSSEIEIKAAAQILALDVTIYGKFFRNRVRDKLGDRAQTFIADLPI